MILNSELYHSNFVSKTCPNCGKFLDKTSKRKFICPNCKNNIYYRVMPQSQSELLLSDSEKELFDLYKSSFCRFDKLSTLKVLLSSDLPSSDGILDELSKEKIAPTFIPMISEMLTVHLANKDLGLYACSLYTLGYLYAISHNYDATFNCFAFRVHLIVNGVQNNMKTLDLNSANPDDSYLYMDYSDLFHIFYLMHPCLPYDFEKFKSCYCSVPIETKIKYRYSIQETYSKIIDLIKKYI